MRLRVPTIFSALLLTAAQTCAQQSFPADSIQTTAADTAGLESVEVRAIRAGSTAPFAKTDLSAADIARANYAQDFPYLLQYTPSAVTTSDAGAGVGYTGLRVRGTDGTRINVTLNGVPVNDAESQGTFFVNFPDLASSTSSIQLQRGVGTSTNGPGAFGATLSIANLVGRDSAGADFTAAYGSFDTRRFTARAGTGPTRSGLWLDLRASHVQSDGYIERSASRLQALQGTAGWRISDRTQLRAMAMAGRERTGQAWNGVPQDSLETNRRFNALGLRRDGTYYPGQTDNYRQDYYQLFADHRFSNNVTAHVGAFLTRGRGYYQEYKLDAAFGDYGRPNVVEGADTFSSTDLVRQLWLDNWFYGGLFSVEWRVRATTLTVGGQAGKYDGQHYGIVTEAASGFPDGYRWYNLDSRKTDANIYAKAEHRVGQALVLYGDVQYRRVDYTMNGFRNNPNLRPDVAYNFFNPKAGLSWTLRNSAASRQRVYASVARAQREPSRDDFEVSPTAVPKPEKLTDFEGGWEWNAQRATAGVNLYYMHYTDQLVLTGAVNDVGAYTRINVPNSFRAGVELQAAFTPLAWLSVGGNATFSRARIRDFVETLDDYDDGVADSIFRGTTPIAFSPAVVGAAFITVRPFRDQGFEAELLGKYVGQQFLDNTGDDARSIPAYGLADARFRYRFTTGRRVRRTVGLQLQLNNLLNRQYVSNGYTFSYRAGGEVATENFYFPQAGFNAVGVLTLGL